jgi:hypothetical protein
MSHFVKAKTKLSNKTFLMSALTRLGYTAKECNFTVTEYGQSSKAEIKLDKALGLAVQEDGTYALVGDPYHAINQKVRGLYGRLDDFTKELGTAYSIEEATSNLADHQFFCNENPEGKIGEDGLIHMCFTNYS